MALADLEAENARLKAENARLVREKGETKLKERIFEVDEGNPPRKTYVLSTNCTIKDDILEFRRSDDRQLPGRLIAAFRCWRTVREISREEFETEMDDNDAAEEPALRNRD